jgi:c-di-GMP-binding flagellar brake protein YcgR
MGCRMKISKFALDRLVGCQAFLDFGHHHSSLGTITYLEGDIFEVNVSKVEGMKAGDQAKVIVYSRDGMINFETRVIATYDHFVILLNPPEIMQMTLQQRNFHRVSVQMTGHIHGMKNGVIHVAKEYPQPLQINIHDIALGGIGFRIVNGEDMLVKSKILVEIIFDKAMLCRVEIVHKKSMGDGYQYGAAFVELADADKTSLRSHILHKQVIARTNGHMNIQIND